MKLLLNILFTAALVIGALAWSFSIVFDHQLAEIQAGETTSYLKP